MPQKDAEREQLRGYAALAAYLVVQQLAVMISPSPWWIPDITAIGLVVTVGRPRAGWLGLSLFAGCVAMALAVRFAGAVLVWYVALGWLVHRLRRHWDASDVRVQSLVAGVSSLVMVLAMLGMGRIGSLSLLWWVVARAALTGLGVWLARWRFAP